MDYHLFVHGANEDINPVYGIKRGKKTGLFSVDMVITKAHFFNYILKLGFLNANAVPIMKISKRIARKPGIYDDLIANKVP